MRGENPSIHRGLDPDGQNADRGVTASWRIDNSAILNKCQEIWDLFWQDRLY